MADNSKEKEGITPPNRVPAHIPPAPKTPLVPTERVVPDHGLKPNDSAGGGKVSRMNEAAPKPIQGKPVEKNPIIKKIQK